MVGESGRSCQKNVYRYYKCITAKRKKLCDKKPVRKEWIEQVCVEKALKVLYDDALLDVLTDRIYELQAEENPRLPYLKEQLSDVEKKITNILARFYLIEHDSVLRKNQIHSKIAASIRL